MLVHQQEATRARVLVRRRVGSTSIRCGERLADCARREVPSASDLWVRPDELEALRGHADFSRERLRDPATGRHRERLPSVRTKAGKFVSTLLTKIRPAGDF